MVKFEALKEKITDVKNKRTKLYNSWRLFAANLERVVGDYESPVKLKWDQNSSLLTMTIDRHVWWIECDPDFKTDTYKIVCHRVDEKGNPIEKSRKTMRVTDLAKNYVEELPGEPISQPYQTERFLLALAGLADIEGGMALKIPDWFY